MKIQHPTLTNKQEESIEQLVAQGIHPILAKIYALRAVQGVEELDQQLTFLAHPHSLKGAQQAGELLADAIQQHIPMIIVADYDCDGATSCALGIRGLKKLAAHLAIDIQFVVPNRFTHGYGLTPDIVDLVLQQMPHAKLLITVDNGISSIEGVDHANKKGLDVLITDHHLSSKSLPNARVIVNPNQPECSFISKNIAGVGVMFYVLMATRIALKNRGFYAENTNGTATIPRLDDLLDLVALGTVADVVKLDALNRCFVSNGIKRMRKGLMQQGILELIHIAGRQIENLNTFDLGFALGPRLNAAGRIEDMKLGIECLISDDVDFTKNAAQQLNALNQQRKHIETDIKQEIDVQLDATELTHPAICLYGEHWHQGVIGIVASRFKEKYHLPTLIFTKNSDIDDGLIKGSGRSIAGFHMRDAIDFISKMHPHIITKFGGHAMAAGLTIQYVYFDEFCQAFYAYAQQHLSCEDLQQIMYIDAELKAEQHHINLIKLIENQTWGQGFHAPIFGNSFIVIEQKILKDQHLKLKLSLKHSPNNVFDAIWFFHADILPSNVYAAYELNINRYMNQERVQLNIKCIA
jgi:single-stranded-DNA-specific exonuclease